ncbi:MAG TPA: class I SAM-dependent methyltransferase [Gammaproteobacteria bacterium]|nr:class I SAM-dependent methyltransferase [Gammaproteobacteria bacterium]
MEPARRANEEQATLWNGLGGRGWVEAQSALDRMLRPFEDLLVESVSAAAGSRVLDVGCGTGSTTLVFARLVGKKGRGVGVDISAPMLAMARERAEQERAPATFVHADAQVHAFEPASFDAIVSRFGVMFFDDSVRAFANLRRAVAPFLPNLPARDPDAPGQFAFADRSRVRRILEDSGWTGIDVVPIDVVCTLPEQDLIRYLTRVGPIGRVLQEADERTRARIMEAIRPAFAPLVDGADVRFTGACWMVGARAE